MPATCSTFYGEDCPFSNKLERMTSLLIPAVFLLAQLFPAAVPPGPGLLHPASLPAGSGLPGQRLRGLRQARLARCHAALLRLPPEGAHSLPRLAPKGVAGPSGLSPQHLVSNLNIGQRAGQQAGCMCVAGQSATQPRILTAKTRSCAGARGVHGRAHPQPVAPAPRESLLRRIQGRVGHCSAAHRLPMPGAQGQGQGQRRRHQLERLGQDSRAAYVDVFHRSPEPRASSALCAAHILGKVLTSFRTAVRVAFQLQGRCVSF